MKPYKLSFRNIKELNNISLHFSNVKNILNSEVETDTAGRTVINSHPDLTYEINDMDRQNEINNFLSKQIVKIQKRKKAIFETFIKDKDSLLENRNDNREADYLISVLDFCNFFGKENIVIETNDRNYEDYYSKISEEIADKLHTIYEKRLREYELKKYENVDNITGSDMDNDPDDDTDNNEDSGTENENNNDSNENMDNEDNEYNKNYGNESKYNNNDNKKKNKGQHGILSRIENQKREINQSYIYMKIFNFIKNNFEYLEPYIDEYGKNEIKYKKEKFLAEIPVIESLNLDFSENTDDFDDSRQLALIAKSVAKARLIFDREKKKILIPKTFLENQEIVYKVMENMAKSEMSDLKILKRENSTEKFVINELSKKEMLKRLAFEKFEEIMKKNMVRIKSEELFSGKQFSENQFLKEKFSEKIQEKWTTEKQSDEYYETDIRLYNINTAKISLWNVVKSVVFKELIDELRPYIVGIQDEKGEIKKESIKLNDMKKISEIADYKKEQIELLFKNKEKNIFKEIEKKYSKLERQYTEQTENEEIRQKIRDDIKSDMEKEKRNYLEFMKKAKDGMDSNLAEFKRKNKDFSFNFKVKNIRKKKEKNFEKREKIIAIFLEDVYNILNRYKKTYIKNEEINNGRTADNRSEKAEKRQDLRTVDTDFLFIKVFTKLSQKFTFIIPFLRKYGDKISDKSVTMAFFNDISNVNVFLENIVYNATDIHIIKDKYKIFRKSDVKKEMIFLNSSGKAAKMKVTYSEYLDYKYSKKYRLNKKNPFEINWKNTSDYGNILPNAYKYHRILGENIKYLFININSEKELKINSKLFENYTEFINTMIILDGVINSGNKILHEEHGEKDKEIILKNFMPDDSIFDIYVNNDYIGTTHYNIDINSETLRNETIEQRLRKMLSGM